MQQPDRRTAMRWGALALAGGLVTVTAACSTDPNSVAWFGDGGYRLAARNAGQFVAIGAPLRERYKDVVVTGTFHKVAGPAGGGWAWNRSPRPASQPPTTAEEEPCASSI